MTSGFRCRVRQNSLTQLLKFGNKKINAYRPISRRSVTYVTSPTIKENSQIASWLSPVKVTGNIPANTFVNAIINIAPIIATPDMRFELEDGFN